MRQSAERRDAEYFIHPHVETAKGDACPGAEFRPERLGVTDLEKIAADCRAAPRALIGDKLVVGAATFQRGGGMFGREHSGIDGIMRTFYARDIYETRR